MTVGRPWFWMGGGAAFLTVASLEWIFKTRVPLSVLVVAGVLFVSGGMTAAVYRESRRRTR